MDNYKEKVEIAKKAFAEYKLNYLASKGFTDSGEDWVVMERAFIQSFIKQMETVNSPRIILE